MMTLEEKRDAVIEFYKKSYRDDDKKPVKIHDSQLRDPLEIARHWQNMVRMKRAMGDFYEKNIGLSNKLDELRGMKPDEDPTEKRGPFE